MATLGGGGVVTLADWAKQQGPDGKPARIAELLNQTNDVLRDMLWKEGNLPTGHQTTVRTGLPSATWRLLNQGSSSSKPTEAQITEQCGLLESWSEVDCAIAKLNGNVASFRANKAKSHLEAMNQEMVGTLFYGNQGTAPEEFNGFATRYSSLGTNVISGSGSGSDNSSIWLIGWGENTIHGIYPKGSSAGLMHHDYGEQTIETTSGIAGQRLRVFQEKFEWTPGLAVEDWRFAVRICNIDISNLTAESSAANLIKLMIKAIHRLPTTAGGTTPDGEFVGVRPSFYMNRTVFEMLDIQRWNTMSGQGTGAQNLGGSITYSDIDGKKVPTFRDIPIGIVDQLTEAEATVA